MRLPDHNAQQADETGAALHTVQFYDELDDRALRWNVGYYLREGLSRGEHCLIVASRAHADAFCSQLGESQAELRRLRSQGRLMLLDADQMLACFMRNGMPDSEKFSVSIGARVRSMAAGAGDASVRAYGEMVGILWKAGNFSAAVRLEELWNAFAREVRFRLYCAYPIDVFGSYFQTDSIDAVVREHQQVLPFGKDGDVAESLDLAMSDVLGSKREVVRHLIRESVQIRHPQLPPGEATILWLRKNLREYADDIMGRAKQHYVTLQAGA